MQEGNIHVVKLLLVFGADVNSLNSELATALDVAVECDNEQAIALLQAVGAVQGEQARKACFDAKIPRLKSFHDTAKIKAHLSLQRQRALVAKQTRNVHRRNESVDSGCPLNSNGGDGETDELGSQLSPTACASGGGGEEGGVFSDQEEEGARERLFSNQSLNKVTLKDMEDGNTLSTLYERLQQCINITLDISGGHWLKCRLYSAIGM